MRDIVVRHVGKRQGGIAGDQKAQCAPVAKVVARALVVHAASIEGVEHPPGAIQMFTPKRPLEQQGRPKVVSGTVKITDVLAYRPLQRGGLKLDGRKRGQRQSEDDEVSLDGFRCSVMPVCQLIRAVRKRLYRTRGRIEFNVRVEFFDQALDDLFVAANDRIYIKIAINVHQYVLKEIETIREMWRGRHVAVAHDGDIPPGNIVVDFGGENDGRADIHPRMRVVGFTDRLIKLLRRQQARTSGAERARGVPGTDAIMLLQHIDALQQMSLKDAATAPNMLDLRFSSCWINSRSGSGPSGE